MRTAYSTSEKLIAFLADPETEQDDHEAICDKVAELGLTYAEFVSLDEKPGRWGYDWDGNEWHYKLRRTRNNTDSRLFEVLAR